MVKDFLERLDSCRGLLKLAVSSAGKTLAWPNTRWHDQATCRLPCLGLDFHETLHEPRLQEGWRASCIVVYYINVKGYDQLQG